jgi:hypothetical protein
LTLLLQFTFYRVWVKPAGTGSRAWWRDGWGRPGRWSAEWYSLWGSLVSASTGSRPDCELPAFVLTLVGKPEQKITHWNYILKRVNCNPLN